MPYQDNNTIISDEQYKKLKASSPSLASKYSYVAPTGSSSSASGKSSSGGASSSSKPSTSSNGNTVLQVEGNGNIGGGSIQLTPEQVAKVNQKNPNLAKNIGLPATSSVGKTSVEEAASKNTAEEDYSLPDRTSHLSSFTSTLTQATELARRARETVNMGVLASKGFTPGNVAPGTFAAIIQNLHNAGANRAQPIIESAQDAFKMDAEGQIKDQNAIRDLALSLVENGASKETVNGILKSKSLDAAIAMAAGALEAGSGNEEIRQVGNKIVAVDPKTNTARVIFDGGGEKGSDNLLSPTEAARLGVPYGTTESQAVSMNITPKMGTGGGGGGGSPATKTITSGGLVTNQATIAAGAQQLNESRGPDGWVNPQIYLDLFNDWVADGGLAQDFIKYYPPKLYVNPANDWLPEFLRNPSKSSSSDSDSVDALIDQYLQ